MNLPPLDEDLDPQEVIAALAPQLSPERAARLDAAAGARQHGVTALLEDLFDPHNYGAVLRSCESVGLGHVFSINTRHRFRVSPRVTQGCERWLEVHRFAAIEECATAVRAAGYRILCAVPGAATSLEQIDPRPPTALAFGSEHLGLSPRLREMADGEFSIPMHGMSQSLNVSVSVALSLYTLTAARRRALGRPGDLDAAEVLRLRARFYAADVRGHRALIARHRADGG